ncbi:MAG: type II secretion system major pseudopilin GspG [Spirochaetaceae bacterium]|jgi:general secretion pathway protein G|nr:type II secretion system major pseudopilin GspG [Spirochaetaceae bacterium]
MNKQKQRNRHDEGWTLIETLIVIGIVLVLSSSVGFMAIKYLDRAKMVSAKSQIETFCLALDAYYLDCGEYPSELQGLAALWSQPNSSQALKFWNGPYLSKNIPDDPWGREYEYRMPGVNHMAYSIRSFGADGLEGGTGNEADICSWE